MNKRYPIRAAKYLGWMLILFAIIFGIMSLTGTSAVQGVEGMKMMLESKGPTLGLMIILLAGVFPLIGYTTRSINGKLSKEQIVDVMREGGFKLSSYHDNVMVFNAVSPLKKFGMYFEDRIEVSIADGSITLDGMRKEIFKLEYRLNKLIIRDID
ncbi:MAG: hypothetical protein R3Y15_01620 [Rikenellaceae bacterium]